MRSCRSVSTVLVAMLCAGATLAAEPVWRIPESTIEIDFTSPGAARGIRFLDDTVSMEIPLSFTVPGRRSVAIDAIILAGSRVEFEVKNPQAAAQVSEIREMSDRVTASLVVTFPELRAEDIDKHVLEVLKTIEAELKAKLAKDMSHQTRKSMAGYLIDHGVSIPDEFEELREAYLDRRATELMPKELRHRLNEIVEKRRNWIPRAQLASVDDLRDSDVLAMFRTLMGYEKADAHLHQCGLVYETNPKNYQSILLAKVRGVYALASGKSINDRTAKQASRGLSARDAAQIRASLTVALQCRCIFDSDPRDPNSDWRNGQVIGSWMPGVGSIRVEGYLDPEQGDDADWWVLEGFAPDKVAMRFDEDNGVAVQGPYITDGEARLRFVADGSKATSYRFELAPKNRPAWKRAIQIYESPFAVGAEFPF